MSQRKIIRTGMRVVVYSSRRSYEATVLELASAYEDSPPDQAKVRYDACWKRDAWESTHSLTPIDGICGLRPNHGE